MDCLETRRLVGADPQRPGEGVLTHLAGCPSCAEYRRQMQRLDARLLDALRVPLAAGTGAGSAAPEAPRRRFERPRWMALAASIVAGVLVGSLLWVGGPRDTLAGDLLAHLDHEPEALVVTTQAADTRLLERVLERGGVRLRPGVGTVSYANSCWFRGRWVPHLVVQAERGPVTVMVLRHEPASRPLRFAEGGISGTVLPAGPGSVAVIGTDGADLGQVAARVLAAVEWVDG
jgi:Protein of unknown function (DUF3379)